MTATITPIDAEAPRMVVLPSLGEVAHIQRVVAQAYGISVEAMKSADRHQSISRPRQVAMYLAHKITKKSYPCIARMFGGLDHTSVVYAVKIVEQRIAGSWIERATVEALCWAVVR